MTRNALAAAYVNRQPDAAHLLEMLGLTIDGIPQPDDTRVYGMDSGSPVAGARPGIESSHYADRPKLSTAPVSLQVLPPQAPVAEARSDRSLAALAARNAATLSPCPSKAARSRHRRNGQTCSVCTNDMIARGYAA